MALALLEENQKNIAQSTEIEDDSTVDYDGGTDYHQHRHQQQCGEQANLVHPGGNRGGHGGFPPAAVGGSIRMKGTKAYSTWFGEPLNGATPARLSPLRRPALQVGHVLSNEEPLRGSPSLTGEQSPTLALHSVFQPVSGNPRSAVGGHSERNVAGNSAAHCAARRDAAGSATGGNAAGSATGRDTRTGSSQGKT